MLLKGSVLPLEERTLVMGILNVTPDSFSDGGDCLSSESAVKRAKEMIEKGADIIDIGGESSRPGSEPVTEEEEVKRIMPVIEALKDTCTVPLSVDTYKSGVARKVLERGVSIINDITALNGDPQMGKVIAEYDAAVVLMHMKGKPKDMQEAPEYDDVVSEVALFLQEAINKAVSAGIDPGKIIIDPGIGFGKRLEDNLKILNRLEEFKSLGKPVLIGTSRKSFIGAITGKKEKERNFGTAASISAAIIGGADIIRVHDVSQMRDVSTVTDAIIGV